MDDDRWAQAPEMLRRLATTTKHARTRERYLAPYKVTQAQSATEVAWRNERHPQTVMRWIHRYNESGPAALIYQHSGGRPPFCGKTGSTRAVRPLQTGPGKSSPAKGKPPGTARQACETLAEHALLNVNIVLGGFSFGGGTFLKDFPEMGDSSRL